MAESDITEAELLEAIEQALGKKVEDGWRTVPDWAEAWGIGSNRARVLIKQARKAGLAEMAWREKDTDGGFRHRYPMYRFKVKE